MEKIQQFIKGGWLVVEASLLLVVLCVLLHIILGKESGAFISSVAANALDFMQKIPAGTLVGVFLILVLYWVIKSRDSSKDTR